MEQGRKMLPIGIDSFRKIRTNNFYYVDKTGMIIDLLGNWSEVTLFTRPRRFGKSLNMSMLEAFFSPEIDKSMFDGLRISGETELCEEYMGQYPVLSVSLKGIWAENFAVAYRLAADVIREAAARVKETIEGKGCSCSRDHETVRRLRENSTGSMERCCIPDRAAAQVPHSGIAGSRERLRSSDYGALEELQCRDMEESVLYSSLYTLSGILKRYYGRDVIILIDEYDVPLAKAYEQGYYDQMVLLIRNLFERALKTNDSLKFAVLTGCMRISKESIFTGLNNLRVLGIADERMEEYFGFTDAEVRQLLAYYGLADRYEEVREWYDGYRFGRVNVYCPWDVINYCDQARGNSQVFPENYWINSSGNQAVRRFIEYASDSSVRSEMESLVNGEVVEKTIRQELTYQEMYVSVDNIWSVLFTTGYLTQKERVSGSCFRLAIPNREVRDIYIEQLLELFRRDVKRDGESVLRFCDALLAGDVPSAERQLTEYLRRTISVRDNAVRDSLKENFYHGILLGILSARADWGITSNQESGDGYSDILVRCGDGETAMVLEIKYAEKEDMDAVCRKALRQIEEKHYAGRLEDEGFEKILKYGIAFYRKKCRILQ